MPVVPPRVKPNVGKRLGLHAPCAGAGVDLTWRHERHPRPTNASMGPTVLARNGWAYNDHAGGLEIGTYWHVPVVSETVLETGFHHAPAPAPAAAGVAGGGGVATVGAGVGAGVTSASATTGAAGAVAPGAFNPARIVSRAWGMPEVIDSSGKPTRVTGDLTVVPVTATVAPSPASTSATAIAKGAAATQRAGDDDSDDDGDLVAMLSKPAPSRSSVGGAAAGAEVRRALEQAEARALRAARALETVTTSPRSRVGNDSGSGSGSGSTTGASPRLAGAGSGSGSTAGRVPASSRRGVWTLRPSPKKVPDFGRIAAHCIGVQVNINVGPSEGKTPLLLACER